MEDTVQYLLKQVAELSDEERFLFLMKLPTEVTQDELDKDTPSSMSRRSKAAVSWLQCKYEEDKSTSVSKQDVYEHYMEDCDATGQLPISGADFGKIIKMVFPSIYNRRLGQRGQSKYCYWGLTLREDAKQIATHDAFHNYSSIQTANRSMESHDVYQLSCQLVCEWASQLLDKSFSDIRSLSEYLISIGLSCGKTAAMFTLMSGSTSPPKLTVDKKTWSSRLVQRRLQHNEIIRKHKEKIKQQLKAQREQQTASVKQRKSPAVLEQKSALHSTGSPNVSSTILHRPLSVQPYMCNSTSSTDNRNQSIWRVSVSSDNTSLSGLQSEIIHPVSRSGHAVAQTKRCQSTSLVEKHLVLPSSLGHLISEQSCRITEKTHGVSNEALSQPQTWAQLLLTSEGTSRSPSVSPLTTPITSCAARNISRLLESPAAPVATVSHQNKRNGDNISQEEKAFVKKRCTTSIGMRKHDSLDIDLKKKEDEFTVVRPFSCPIPFYEPHSLNLKVKKKGAKIAQSNFKLKSPGSQTTDNVTLQSLMMKEKQQSIKLADNPAETKSYHLVQKPQVISRAQRHVSISSSGASNSNQTHNEPTGRTRYNILNSLLSSDCDMVPDVTASTPLLQPVPHLRRIPGSTQTTDNTGFRSAFVPVTSHKQLTHSTNTEESNQQNLASDGECIGKNEKTRPLVQPSEKNKYPNVDSARSTFTLIELKTDKSTCLITQRGQDCLHSQFPCATSTSSSSSSSSTLCQSGDSVVSVVDSAFATPTPTTTSETTGSRKIPALASASAPATLSKVSSSMALAQVVSAAQSAATGPECTSITANSPSFAARKIVKNRFTPIRPKLDACFNISPQKVRPASTSASPQKRDMRPVHALLLEHRTRNTQDLLANLAHNYHTAPGNVLVSMGPTKVEGSQGNIQLMPAPLAVSSIMPLSQPVHTNPQGIATSCHSTVSQLQLAPTVSHMPLQKDSQVVVLPPSSPKQSAVGCKPFLVQDMKGNQYAVDEQPAGSFLLQPDLQTVVQPSATKAVSTPNLLSLNTTQIHVVGPDAQGQTYLLVPNSDQGLPPIRSKSCVPSSVSSMKAGGPLSLTSMSSSSGLLAELSELASKADTATGHGEQQALTQHSSASSAFHKCSSVIEIPIDSTRSTNKSKGCEGEGNKGFNSGKTHQHQVSENPSGLAAKEDLGKEVIDFHADKRTPLELKEKTEAGKDKCVAISAKKKMEIQGEKAQHPQFLVPKESTRVSISAALQNRDGTLKSNTCTEFDSETPFGRSDATEQEMILPHLLIRKRKAAAGGITEHEGKKRTGCSIDSNGKEENMENVEPSDLPEPNKGKSNIAEMQKSSEPIIVQEDSEASAGSIPTKAKPLSDTAANQTDTETLLTMIGDTKSMTVKEVVSALNDLRAKLRSDCGQKSKSIFSCEGQTKSLNFSQTKHTKAAEKKGSPEKARVSTPDTSPIPTTCGKSLGLEVPAQVSQQKRPSRRNISLNLESLEIDALLDMEPGLDSKLVGDMGGRTMNQPVQQVGRRTSVGTAAKQSLPVSTKRNRSCSLRRFDSVSALSELGKEKRPASVSVIDPRDKSYKHACNQDALAKKVASQQAKRKVNERSRALMLNNPEPGDTHQISSTVACLNPNIGVKHTSDLLNSGGAAAQGDILNLEHDIVKNESEQDKLKALIQKDVSRNKTSSDSDLPVDIIDFITESMSVGTSYQSNPFNQNPISSWLADVEDSIHSNKPVGEPGVLHTVKKVKGKQPIIAEGNVMLETLLMQQKNQTVPQGENHFEHIDNFSFKTSTTLCTQGTPISDCTFLSPTGPAKSTRRPSMERVTSIDRSTVRTPAEPARPPSRLKVRTETPVESFSLAANDYITAGKQSHVKRDCLSARDHTTAVMLQQVITQHGQNQTTTDFPSETCISSFMRQGSAELCRADRALSETPVSDPGYSSVGQTPVSEVGCSSISPSPVMMSMDSTFRPVKSDSETNQTNGECFTSSAEAEVELSNPVTLDKQIRVKGPCGMSSLLPSQGDIACDSNNKNVSKTSSLSETLFALSDLDHLMSVRLQCIPTPPSSPSGSPQLQRETFNSPLPFDSLSEQKQRTKANTSSPFVAPSCPPSFAPSSASTSAVYRLNITTNSPVVVAHADFTSPGIISRFSPSPHTSTRPSCSPYQPYPHPSPPFTPSSQRCPTPSTIAILSPRSNTPCGDTTVAPNRFMPIQTSGILATSMTLTQTYIQPIKPVVTLASVSSQKNLSSSGPNLSGFLPTPPLRTSTPQQYSNFKSDLAKHNQCHFPPFQVDPAEQFQKNTPKKAHQSYESKAVHRPTSSAPLNVSTCSSKPGLDVNAEMAGQPALVLSLSGNIGSVSLAGQGMPSGYRGAWLNCSQQDQSRALPSYQEAVSKIPGADTAATSGRAQFHTVQGGLKFRKVGSPVKCSTQTLSEPQPQLRVYPADPCSVLRSEPKFTSGTLDSQLSMPTLQHGFSDVAGVNTVSNSTDAAPQISKYHKIPASDLHRVCLAGSPGPSVSLRKETGEMGSDFSTPGFCLNPAHDDLAETLDVLKSLDSQYFQHDEDSNSSTSL